MCGNHPPVSSSVWLCNCQLVGNYVLAMVVCCVKLAIKALKRKKEEEKKKKKKEEKNGSLKLKHVVKGSVSDLPAVLKLWL